MIRLLLVAASVVLSSTQLIDFVAIDDRRYYCSDREHRIGDCSDGRYRSRDRGYGYRRGEGRNVGVGRSYVTRGGDAELVCDFREDGNIRGRVENIAWLKVSDTRRPGRAGRYSRRHNGYDRYERKRYDGRRRDRLRSGRSDSRDIYSDRYRHSNIVRTRDGISTYYIRDFTEADYGRYQCFGTLADNSVVRMEVVFDSRRPGSGPTDIVFTSEDAF